MFIEYHCWLISTITLRSLRSRYTFLSIITSLNNANDWYLTQNHWENRIERFLSFDPILTLSSSSSPIPKQSYTFQFFIIHFLFQFFFSNFSMYTMVHISHVHDRTSIIFFERRWGLNIWNVGSKADRITNKDPYCFYYISNNKVIQLGCNYNGREKCFCH